MRTNEVVSRVAGKLADWCVGAPLRVLAVLGLLGAAAVISLNLSPGFDSDILNVLPSGYRTVEGLRLYDSGFEQSRELAFVLEWEVPPDDPDAAREQFCHSLRGQPWVERILGSPPIELEDLSIVPPLLLQLPPSELQSLLDSLQPEPLRARLDRLKSAALAGSPHARLQLESDPLGIGQAALAPVAEKISFQHAFELASADGKLQVVPCLTRQTDTSPSGCHDLMAQVNEWIRSMDKLPGGPTISVTGRAAYVDQVSRSMERDIQITSGVSLFAVIGIFWLGYRRLLPLLGIALILGLAALLTVSVGQWVFGGLNLIAIGFCSILFGLGDDFSLLICQRYESALGGGQSRRQAIAGALAGSAPGIAAVTLTTAAGFVSLLFAGSAGFRQLGFLVALGLVLAASLMFFGLPVFLRQRQAVVLRCGPCGDNRLLRNAQPLLTVVGIVALGAGVIALGPWFPLRFDLSPRSLEPRNAPAAETLSRIMAAFPDSFEPILVIVEDADRARLREVDAIVQQCITDGLLAGASSPTPLFIDREAADRSLSALRDFDLSHLRSGMLTAASSAGIRGDFLDPWLDTIGAAAGFDARSGWADFLRPDSSWWFLLDRLISSDGRMVAYQLEPVEGLSTQQRIGLGDRLHAVPGVFCTGWSQALALLTPWAQSELSTFGGAVFFVIVVILATIYRSAWKLALHIAALILSGLTGLAVVRWLGMEINILNVLAVPLVVAVGVDYGTHILLAVSERDGLGQVLKPILLSGLTTIVGFGSLSLASNPPLAGLGQLCAIGVGSCLAVSLLFVAPAAAVLAARSGPPPKT